MPFTSEEIATAGKAALDHYLKNNPVDQINIEHPFFNMLQQGKRQFPGAKENVVEQLHFTNDQNFQWFNGSTVVTYNRRRTIEQASFPWKSAHDGFALDEDRLIQNGISIVEGPGGKFDASTNPDSEAMRLTNLFEEQMSSLKNGFVAKMEEFLLLDGTVETDSITGLDALVSDDGLGTVGGINSTNDTWWKSRVRTGLTTTTTTGDIVDKMEELWRECVRTARTAPNFMIVGSDFMDGYSNFYKKTFGSANFDLSTAAAQDAGRAGNATPTDTGLRFKGVPLVWMPIFSELDTSYSPTIDWEKRCYMLNKRHLKLRPIAKQDMVTRKPPRAYDRYEYYWGLTWRGALTINNRGANGFASIA